MLKRTITEQKNSVYGLTLFLYKEKKVGNFASDIEIFIDIIDLQHKVIFNKSHDAAKTRLLFA